ncbi:Anoctamin-7 [Actinomortierella ambigua]|nr:Anoctamin-7 [Actinomortierella ambigua]
MSSRHRQQQKRFISKHRTKIRRERPSKAKIREWKIQHHRRQFQLALLREGLFIELEKSIHSDAVYVKILAPFWRLLDEAEKTMCKADIASRETVLFKKSRLHDYHLAEASRRWSDIVRHSGAVNRNGIHTGGNCGSDGKPGFFLTSRRGYLVNSIMMRTETRYSTSGRNLGLRSALRRGAYQKIFALHDGPYKLQSIPVDQANVRAQLNHRWAKRFYGGHPLNLVVDYYGERIGVYFACLNQLDASPNVLFAIFDNALTMPFALFMSLWSTIYIEFWKRANKFYAYRWHMLDYERIELPRTEFRATHTRTSPVTGKKEPYYPTSVVAAAILNLFIIVALGEIWCRLAEWLTDKENHKYTDAYEAPAFALINNVIDIRMEARRLLTQYRRPIAFRAQDIGIWEQIMEFVSFTSVITNAAIIAFSSLWVKQNLFVNYLHATTEGELLAARLGFILVFEHVVFLFKVVFRAAISDVPLPIKLALERSKYKDRVAHEGIGSEQDEDVDDTWSGDDDDVYPSDAELSNESGDGREDDGSSKIDIGRSSGGGGGRSSGGGFFGPECRDCAVPSLMTTSHAMTNVSLDSNSNAYLSASRADDNQPLPPTVVGVPSLFPWKDRRNLPLDADNLEPEHEQLRLSRKQTGGSNKQRNRQHLHCHHHQWLKRQQQQQQQQGSIPTIAEERIPSAQQQEDSILPNRKSRDVL